MVRDEIMQISEIVGGDTFYKKFVKRISKEFDLRDKDSNSKVHVIFQEDENGDNYVGFCVFGFSDAKMNFWEKTFKEEKWVSEDYHMIKPSYELMYMYIRPEYRDKGYGSRLFKKAIKFSRENSMKAIYSYVSDTTNLSLNFYKQMGAKTLIDFSEDEFATVFLQWIL